MNNETQVQIQNKFCLTIDEAVIYFNIGEKKLRKLVADNLDSGFIIQNGVKFLIKRKRTPGAYCEQDRIWMAVICRRAGTFI